MGPAAAAAAIGRMEGEGHDERERVVKRKLAYRGSEVGVGMRKMKRYRGRLSSRAEMDIEPGVFEVNGGDGGEDDDDDEEIESEGFESESEVEEEEGDGGMGKVGVAETEEEKLEREVGELEKEERIAARNLGKERRADVVKGKAVREQKALYDSLLNIRIRMQPMVDEAMRIPRPADLKEYGELSPKVDKVCGTIQSILDALDKAHVSITNSSKILEKKHKAENHDDDESIDSEDGDDKDDEEQDDMDGSEKNKSKKKISMREIMAWKDAEVDKWGRKVDEATGKGLAMKSKFKAVDLSISGQIRHTLKDRERLLKKSRRIRGKVDVIGSGEIEDEEDEEHFCDADFYQRLLRDVIEQGEGGLQRMVDLRRKSRRRKEVDRKASKGRKLRYVVHDKLVGFLAPVPFKESRAVDELVKGIFGKRPTISKKDNDSEE